MSRNNETRDAIEESATEGEHVSHYAKYKSSHLKYQNSEKGKAARQKYQNSEKGKAAQKRAQKKRAEKIKRGLALLNENES